MEAFVAADFKAVVTCVDSSLLGAECLGREIDEGFLRDLPPGVDLCGERGEYHSFVFDGPIFQSPVPFQMVGRGCGGSADPAGIGADRYRHCELV